MAQEINTLPELIERLGGTGSTATTLEAKHPSTVSMWLSRGNIPPRHFPRHAEILKGRGIIASPALWFGAAA